ATANTSAPGATGHIEFFVNIDDEFTFPQLGDKYVDKEDPINNCVDINGTVMTNLNTETPLPTSTSVVARDDSKTAIAIVGDPLMKTVYAVKRNNSFICGPVSVLPGGPFCFNFPQPPQE